MSNAQNNGNEGTLILTPTDKVVIIRVDEATKQIAVAGSNIPEDEVIDLLYVALAQAINSLKAKLPPKSNLVTLPPGSRLKGGL